MQDSGPHYKLSHYKVAVFDMDSTLIEEEVIDELAIEAGVGQAVATITAAAMAGELDFDQSLRRRVALLKGLDEAALERVYARLTPTAGAAELITHFKAAGLVTAVVSGGFMSLCQPMATRLALDHCYANDLEIKAGKLTGRLVDDRVAVNAEGKRQVLKDLCHRGGHGLSASIAIGDGANDIPMVSAAGLGIAFRAKAKLIAAAKVSLPGPSLLQVWDILNA